MFKRIRCFDRCVFNRDFFFFKRKNNVCKETIIPTAGPDAPQVPCQAHRNQGLDCISTELHIRAVPHMQAPSRKVNCTHEIPTIQQAAWTSPAKWLYQLLCQGWLEKPYKVWPSLKSYRWSMATKGRRIRFLPGQAPVWVIQPQVVSPGCVHIVTMPNGLKRLYVQIWRAQR